MLMTAVKNPHIQVSGETSLSLMVYLPFTGDGMGVDVGIPEVALIEIGR